MTAALTAVAACVGASQAQAREFDDYLESGSLNTPGERLERRDTLRVRQDTTAATVQSDVFNPPRSGGPAELTTCGSTAYGHTVWYDFYPDVQGSVRLRASGYDSVITVVPFNRTTFVPSFDRALCVNRETANSTEEFLVQVERGRAYTIQIGGVGAAAGMLDFQFDFFADTDGDGVFDENDNCRTLAGTRRNGCPVTLRVDSTLRARAVPGGIEVVSLAVTAPRRSRVAASCSRGCAREVQRSQGTVRLRRVQGRRLDAGASIVIRVTRRGAIGKYIRYRILDGNFKRVERCTLPGSRKPRRRCR